MDLNVVGSVYLLRALTAVLAFAACIIPVQSFSDTNYITENDITYYEESYEHYLLIGDYEFLERELRTLESRVCVHLYKDPAWQYSGGDRINVLLERGEHYVKVEIENSKAAAQNGAIRQDHTPATELDEAKARILDLEMKVETLEKKIAQKEASSWNRSGCCYN